jgi:hypothetical protein
MARRTRQALACGGSGTGGIAAFHGFSPVACLEWRERPQPARRPSAGPGYPLQAGRGPVEELSYRSGPHRPRCFSPAVTGFLPIGGRRAEFALTVGTANARADKPARAAVVAVTGKEGAVAAAVRLDGVGALAANAIGARWADAGQTYPHAPQLSGSLPKRLVHLPSPQSAAPLTPAAAPGSKWQDTKPAQGPQTPPSERLGVVDPAAGGALQPLQSLALELPVPILRTGGCRLHRS